MGITSSGNGKKDLNVELNLMPVFDILAVCICFLLMTVVWIQVGVIKTSQSQGAVEQTEKKPAPSVWVTIDEKSNVSFTFKNADKNLARNIKDRKLSANQGNLNLEKVTQVIHSMENQGFETALIMPAKNTSYNNIIKIMDSFKQVGLKDIGLSPL